VPDNEEGGLELRVEIHGGVGKQVAVNDGAGLERDARARACARGAAPPRRPMFTQLAIKLMSKGYQIVRRRECRHARVLIKRPTTKQHV
jgi:hypothetical protein